MVCEQIDDTMQVNLKSVGLRHLVFWPSSVLVRGLQAWERLVQLLEQGESCIDARINVQQQLSIGHAMLTVDQNFGEDAAIAVVWEVNYDGLWKQVLTVPRIQNG